MPSDEHGLVRVIATDGQTTAQLESILSYKLSPLGGFGLIRQQETENNSLICRLDGGGMQVSSSALFYLSGRPWALVTWHATLAKTSSSLLH